MGRHLRSDLLKDLRRDVTTTKVAPVRVNTETSLLICANFLASLFK